MQRSWFKAKVLVLFPSNLCPVSRHSGHWSPETWGTLLVSLESHLSPLNMPWWHHDYLNERIRHAKQVIFPAPLHLAVLIVVQLLSRVQFFATPWIAALQALLSSTISQSLLKFMSIESMMLSNHLMFPYFKTKVSDLPLLFCFFFFCYSIWF